MANENLSITPPRRDLSEEIQLDFSYNGKPVYRRHLEFSGPTSNDKVNDILYINYYTLPFSFVTLITMTGYIKFNTGNHVVLSSYQVNSPGASPVSGRLMYMNSTNSLQISVTPTWLGATIHVDLEYTKV